MKMLPMAAAVAAAVVVSGCAVSPETISCLQPNRRVVVEVGGFKVKPAPAPKPGAKPGKPGRDNVLLTRLAQGDSAFDFGSAVLKDGGKAELDGLVKIIHSGAGKDKRPTNVGSIIITGHTDQVEASDSANKDLDEKRAVAVKDYLVGKGVDSKLIFWEGKNSKEPVPVTKFCDI
ncbi:MAG: OmpA family protein [Burkholderiales bacterium]|nr:OmpA family protein [Burkholderiales bacterium]